MYFITGVGDTSTGAGASYHAGKNDYLPVFFEGLITEFGNNYRNRFFPWGSHFRVR